MITGTPSPPFLMIAPNGAPMKKNMMHDRASVNLFIASILCWRSSLSPSPVTIALNCSSFMLFCTVDMALFTALSLLSAVSDSNFFFTLNFPLSTSFFILMESLLEIFWLPRSMNRASL